MPNSVGTVWVDVRFNVGDVSRQLQSAISAASRTAAPVGGAGGALDPTPMVRNWRAAFTELGEGAQKLGRSMSVGLTLPLTLIGKSAVASFNEFDRAMTQIGALNAVPIEQTEQWRTEVRDLGKDYGIAAEEAAKGLYFITSSGVEAADAMGVLDVATKGAAVGLGETKVVADVVTSALSAYGAANQSAAKTGDQLVAAVHYGKGEADELAGALSQVIPIAANLNVAFGEAAGAVTAMTLSGTSADQAATQLRGLFNTLQDMPEINQRALKTYTGLDYAQVRMKLTTEGLIPTLKAVYDAFGDNKVAMGEVFGNIRALTGVFNLFGNNTARTVEIVDKVTHATGELNAAWGVTAESKSKKLEVAMNTVHDAMVGLGADIVPALAPVVDILGKMAGVFGALPEPIRATAVVIGGLVAATGPALWAFGQLSTNAARLGDGISKVISLAPGLGRVGEAVGVRWQFLSDAYRNSERWGGSVGGLTAAVGAWAGALVLVAVAYQSIASYQADVKRLQDELLKTGRTAAAAGGIKEAENELGRVTNELYNIDAFAKKWEKDRQSFNPFSSLGAFLDTGEAKAAADAADPLLKLREEIKNNLAISQKMSVQRGIDREAAYKWLATEAQAGHVYDTAEAALTAYNIALLKNDPAAVAASQSTLKATNSLEGMIAAAKVASDAFFGLRDAEKRHDDALRGVDDAKQKVVDAETAHRDAMQRTLEANRKIIDAQRKATESTEALRDARLKLADAEKELQDALAGPSEEERLDVEGARIALQRAQKAIQGAKDPLDRRQAQLDVRRARIDLRRARGAHGERVLEAEQNVASARKTVADAVQAEVDANQGVVDARNAATRAQQDQAKAYDAIGAAQRGVDDAQRELFDSTLNLAVKQGELGSIIENNAGAGQKFLDYLTALKAQYPETASTIDQYITKFNDLRNAQKPPDVKGGVVSVDGQDYVVVEGIGIVPVQRAAGGLLAAGQLSTVNERGAPEMWSAGGKQYLLPTTHGQVTPLKPLDVNVSPRGHDGVTVGDVYVQGATDPVATAYEVRRQLRVKTRTRGRT